MLVKTQANFLTLRLHHIKFQIPTALGLSFLMKAHYFQELEFSEEIPHYRDKNYYLKNKYHF